MKAITAASIKPALDSAGASGINTVRVYGFSLPLSEEVRETFRDAFTRYGIRVLYTLTCYKSTTMISKDTVISETAKVAEEFAGEDFIFGYDLCNEPDDEGATFPCSLDIGNGTSLGELHPDCDKLSLVSKALCGGWSTTFGERCGNLTAPLLENPGLTDALRGIISDASAALELWIDWRREGLKLGGDQKRLVTIGHNALHALLPAVRHFHYSPTTLLLSCRPLSYITVLDNISKDPYDVWYCKLHFI